MGEHLCCLGPLHCFFRLGSHFIGVFGTEVVNLCLEFEFVASLCLILGFGIFIQVSRLITTMLHAQGPFDLVDCTGCPSLVDYRGAPPLLLMHVLGLVRDLYLDLVVVTVLFKPVLCLFEWLNCVLLRIILLNNY